MSLQMNTLFKDDALGFMKKYAVQPGDDIGNTGVKMTALESNLGNYFFKNMHESKRVGYLNFDEQPSGGGAAGLGGLVKVTGRLNLVHGDVKSYFLPWKTNEIIRLTIPARDAALIDDDVKYFFTAAISGCSIFIKGTPKSPVIFHAGGNTGESNPVKAAEFWREMMEQHPLSAGPVAEINKTHYVTDSQAHGVGVTAHSRQFETWLKATATRDLNVEGVAATGCVMGIRDLQDNWSFYLQENVTITHSKFKKKLLGGFSKTNTVVGSKTTSCRPMLFRKFFPGGLGQADFRPGMPRAI
jgi:hypothetical protein